MPWPIESNAMYYKRNKGLHIDLYILWTMETDTPDHERSTGFRFKRLGSGIDYENDNVNKTFAFTVSAFRKHFENKHGSIGFRKFILIMGLL